MCVRLDWNEWKINNFTLDEEWELCVSRTRTVWRSWTAPGEVCSALRTQFSRSFFILITSEFPFPPVMCRKIYWSSWVGEEESWHWHSAKGTSNWSQSIFWTRSHAVPRSDETEHFLLFLSLSSESFLSIFHQRFSSPSSQSWRKTNSGKRRRCAEVKWYMRNGSTAKKRDARVSTFGAPACTSAAADSFISCVQFMPVPASVIIVGRERGNIYCK